LSFTESIAGRVENLEIKMKNVTHRSVGQIGDGWAKVTVFVELAKAMQSLTEAHSGVKVFAGFQQLVIKDKNGAVKLLC
jgi:hypothetical protein